MEGIATEDADLAFAPVWRRRELLDDQTVSSVELTEPFLRRMEAPGYKGHGSSTVQQFNGGLHLPLDQLKLSESGIC